MEEQLNAARVWDIGACASTMTMDTFKLQLTTLTLFTNVTAVLHFNPEGPHQDHGCATSVLPA